jgi:hypothetical protein
MKTAQNEVFLTRTDFLRAGCLGVAAVVVYVLTLAPGLLLNDSAEFQTLAATLGHTHPTGYGVYLLLGKVATWIPLRDVAYRVNLLSALMGGIAIAGIVLLAQLAGGKRRLPIAGAVALAISPTFWSQAIIAEVYVPAAAFMIGVMTALLLWQQNGKTGWLFAAGCLGGASIGIHATVSLMAPAAVVFVIIQLRRRWAAGLWAVAGAATGVALTALSFALVDSNSPKSDYFKAVVIPSCSEWGLQPEDLDTLSERMRFSLSGRQYQTKLLRQSSPAVFQQLSLFAGNLTNEFPLLWLLLAAVGWARLVSVNWQFALLSLLTFIAHFLYVLSYDMGDIHVCYIPIYILIAVCGVMGLESLVWYSQKLKFPTRWKVSIIERTLLLAALIVVILPLFHANAWTNENRRAVWTPEGEEPFRVDYRAETKAIRNAVKALEDDAILFTDWGLLYALYYVAHVEQGRTGLTFLQDLPAIDQKRLATSAVQYIAAQAPVRPVYLTELVPGIPQDFNIVPVERRGITLLRVYPKR